MKSTKPAFRSYWLKDVNPLSGQKKRRRISSPNPAMRSLHAQMIAKIRGLRIKMPNSKAGRRGNSAFKNVGCHRKKKGIGFNRYLFLADISSAYQSVDLEKLIEVFLLVGFMETPEVESMRIFLKQNFFDSKLGGIVTGGPASPDIFNLYCEVLIDRKLRELCEPYGLTYTRYIDDLTFSSLRPIGAKKRKALRKVISGAGFTISDRKARVYDLRKGPVAINGVGITLDGRVFLPRGVLAHIKGLVFMALQGRNIKHALIHGKMGLLKAVTSARGANQTERKVFRLYDEFVRRNHGVGKSKKSRVPPVQLIFDTLN